MKEHRYHWDDVIVGYSLSALIYAFYSGMPVIGYMSSAPWHFEKLRFEIDLSEYGMGKGIVRSEIELWNHLYMLLSMGGRRFSSYYSQSFSRCQRRMHCKMDIR
jgi:hypothetical protein